MTVQDFESRIAGLEGITQLLAQMVSSQGGELQALRSALTGLLTVAGNAEQVRQQVELHLERCAAHNLAVSTNQTHMDGFDSMAKLIRLAMDSASERKANSGANIEPPPPHDAA